MPGLSDYLILSTLLFVLGCVGIVINRQNVIILLMCIELILLAISTNFIAFSHHYQNIDGQIMVFFILAVAAAETAVGLGIIIAMYRVYKTVDISTLSKLKG